MCNYLCEKYQLDEPTLIYLLTEEDVILVSGFVFSHTTLMVLI